MTIMANFSMDVEVDESSSELQLNHIITIIMKLIVMHIEASSWSDGRFSTCCSGKELSWSAHSS